MPLHTPLNPVPALSPPEIQRVLGTVLGAAVGDALGAPFEFGPAGAWSARFAQPLHGASTEMVGGGAFGWGPGEFTDDTQMALALALALQAAGGYDPDVVWQHWRAWAGDAADVGLTTRRALDFADWREVEHPDPERTAANGALMRAFVLAPALLALPDYRAQAVVLHQAALTHPHPAAAWGAWLAVAMMRSAIRGGDLFRALERELAALPPLLAEPFRQTLQPGWHPGLPHPGNGSVWGCLAQAVWAVRSTARYADAVRAAVDLGGDTDTVACVAGALAGARYGVQAIPSRWATAVHGRLRGPAGGHRFDNAGLQHLALHLAGQEPVVEQPPEPAAGPAEVAPGLHAANLAGASAAPADWAVVSLCRTGTRFAGHAVRRQVYMVDQAGGHNEALAEGLGDVLDSVDAFLAEGRRVVVHCHGGRSRTALVLKAWHMRHTGCTEHEAHDWLSAHWPLAQRLNADFTRLLRGGHQGGG
jgi:ADP-ribosyl-[dinitrogen reductase] hydrolase